MNIRGRGELKIGLKRPRAARALIFLVKRWNNDVY